MQRSYIYLHGFASSPRSTKAQDLLHRFAQHNISLQLPDLNQGDFTHLTLSRQLRQVEATLPPSPTSVTLIGSSFGGLTAAWMGQQYAQVDRLVLLAPAFSFLAHWLPRLGDWQIQQWQSEGTLSVYHYGKQKMLPLDYGFVTDAELYQEKALQRPIPTLILHGRQDDVIPIESSRQFAQNRSWVQLIELDSDHSLTDVADQIWQEMQRFCRLQPEPSADLGAKDR